jgi:hypothetical protein
MLQRYLDVCLQYLWFLVVAAVLAPGLLGLGGLFVDRSHPVTARIWAQPPTYLLDASIYGGFYGVSAQTEATLMANLLHQLVGTDSFSDRVLAGADSTYRVSGAGQKSARRMTFRGALRVTTEGSHIVVLSYQVDRPEYGVAVLNSLISIFGESAPVIHFDPPRLIGTAGSQLTTARAAVAQAYSSLGTGHPNQPSPPRAGGFATLRAEAGAETVEYRSRLAQLVGTVQPDPALVAIPHLQQAIFQVMDPPTAQPVSIDGLFKLVAFGFAAAVAAEMLLVYVVGLFDPRIRSGKDIENRTGIRYLGSPVVRIG